MPHFLPFLALLAAAVLGWALHCAAGEPPRMDGTISNSGSGTIVLRSGQAFTAYPGTAARMVSWLPGDKVTLCPLGGSSYEIINACRKSSVKVMRRR